VAPAVRSVHRRVKLRRWLIASGGATLLAMLPARWLNERQPRELDPAIVSENDLEHSLRTFAQQGARGLPAVVKALHAPQIQARRLAREILTDRLAAWEQSPANGTPAAACVLAEALAAEMSQMDAETQAFARHTASRLLAARMQVGTPDSKRLLLACEQVLRAPAPRGSGAPQAPRIVRAGPPTADEAEQELIARMEKRANQALLQQLELAGGGLPIEPGQLPHSGSDALRELADHSDARPLIAADSDANASSNSVHAPNEPNTSANLSRVPIPRMRQPPTVRRLATEEVDPGSNNMETVALMHQLHANNAQAVEHAEARLQRMGFGPVQLELARQMTDPDPAVRKALAEVLPRVPGIDAEIWLVWLCRDEDSRVRMTALTVMATTGDPKIMRRVIQLAREDSDPRIREQVERLTATQTLRR